MSQNLITNQDKFLSEVINNILPGCDKAYFLVGYFYFSGFQEIYEQLGSMPKVRGYFFVDRS